MALKAVDDISSDMDRLEKVGGLRGEASAQEQKKLVTACESLEDTVKVSEDDAGGGRQNADFWHSRMPSTSKKASLRSWS